MLRKTLRFWPQKMKSTILTASLISGVAACSPKPGDSMTITLTPPKSTQASDTIHIVGSFNDWNIDGLRAKKMTLVDGKYQVQLAKSDEPIFYTMVKNQSWQHQPAAADGKGFCQFVAKGDEPLVEHSFAAWGGDTPTAELVSTKVGNIEHLKNIEIPQLNRERDVWVYLPPSYSENQERTYPVLYMLDGQNVFDRKTSYAGEWRVDESLETLFKQSPVQEFVVVAVANGPKRMSEYSPWDFVYGEDAHVGEGKQTLDFITQSLMPLINNKYRVSQDRTQTGLAGSSLGGMMAIYGAMEYSQHFGLVAAFSPSLSIENRHGKNVLFNAIEQSSAIDEVKIYADMGLAEYGNYDKTDYLSEILLNKLDDKNNLRVVKDDLGRHCEPSWAERFPNAVTWLYQ